MSLRRALDVARAPSAPPSARLYESHYLTAVAPEGGRAVWLRYTSLKSSAESARGSLWCTVFDAGEPPIARRTVSPALLSSPQPGSWAQINGATIGPGHAEGRLEDCAWAIDWDAHAPSLPYLPARWLYDLRLPRSNGVALAPSARFSGHVEVAGKQLDLAGWRGMVGHNWGADHAERWVWLHATGLGERDPDGWIDVILARVAIGPVLSPWLPAGAVQLNGKLGPIRAGASSRGLRVEIRQDTVSVSLPHLPGDALTLQATSPPKGTVHWDYASPRGRPRNVRHCSIASARLEIGARPAFELFQSFSVEIGM